MGRGTGKQMRVTHAQFYDVCQWVKNLADLKDPTTLPLLAQQASEHMKIPISAQTVKDALEATGKRYTPIMSATNAATHPFNDARVLAEAIAKLYERLGEIVPVDIRAILERGK